jgi:hypothetical protein
MATLREDPTEVETLGPLFHRGISKHRSESLSQYLSV